MVDYESGLLCFKGQKPMTTVTQSLELLDEAREMVDLLNQEIRFQTQRLNYWQARVSGLVEAERVAQKVWIQKEALS
jgi:hypothetical protein